MLLARNSCGQSDKLGVSEVVSLLIYSVSEVLISGSVWRAAEPGSNPSLSLLYSTFGPILRPSDGSCVLNSARHHNLFLA